MLATAPSILAFGWRYPLMNSPPATASARILAIDDSPSVLVALENLLPTFGYAVLTAGNGNAGLEIAAKDGVDLILLDVDMPIGGGIAVLETLRSKPDLQHPPVVMMTGRTNFGVISRALAAGACSVISKPFNLVVLQGTLAQHLPLAVGYLPRRPLSSEGSSLKESSSRTPIRQS
jgi:CheY-like chemotaxis protein